MNYGRQMASYQPGQVTTYKVSRSKIEFFLECPRCFWLDQRLKIKRPDTPPFLINSAVDELFKTEFDSYRAKGEQHPLQVKFKVPAKPYAHKDLDTWRHTFSGITYKHPQTNLTIFGGVDDVWINDDDELVIVDYKATAKRKEITDLDPPGGWHDAYRRQMEVYQWLFKQNGFKTSDTGYFVYANGDATQPEFADKVVFRTNVFPYEGDSSWVEPTVVKIKDCLEGDMPVNSPGCNYCNYTADRLKLTLAALKGKKP